MSPFTFAVLADTHVRAGPPDPQACFPSDAVQTARCERAVALIRTRGPAFCVHLGDLCHTLPRLPEQEPTWRRAAAILGRLGCALHVAPGNHDVGDKPGSRALAPAADEDGYAAFERCWGPSWQVVEHEGCRFVLIDSPALGSGSARERAQWTWLEQALAGASRSFVFLHYPPFLLDPAEPAHYDNLAPEPRARLLDLLRRHRVEALFAGHVHNFFHHALDGTEHWLVPSTAFVRPEYAELFPVPPERENGRDDPEKLGFFLVHVEEHGHRIEWVCPARVAGDAPPPPQPSPLGVWLRGAWARTVDLPAGDLDPFDRKRARCDWAELMLLDLGLRAARVQLSDLADPELRARIAVLHGRGLRFWAASAGPPEAAELELLAREAALLEGWELLLPPGAALPPLAAPPLPIALSRIDPGPPGRGGYHSHFPELGFLPGDAPRAAELPPWAAWLAFRIPDGLDPAEGIARAAAEAAALGRRALCHVELPRGDELHPPPEDGAAEGRVLAAAAAADAHPEVLVFLDGLLDKDRGYHPRPGLLDRRCNPRAAARALRGRGAVG